MNFIAHSPISDRAIEVLPGVARVLSCSYILSGQALLFVNVISPICAPGDNAPHPPSSGFFIDYHSSRLTCFLYITYQSW